MARGQHWTPRADNTGIAAVKEHLPKPDRSLITAAFLIGNTSNLDFSRLVTPIIIRTDIMYIAKKEINNKVRLKAK